MGRTYSIYLNGKATDIPVVPASLFEAFLDAKNKLLKGVLVKIQRYRFTSNKEFMESVRNLQSVMHQFCRDQNNAVLSSLAYEALAVYVQILKDHLGVHGEIIPDNEEEAAIMEIMES